MYYRIGKAMVIKWHEIRIVDQDKLGKVRNDINKDPNKINTKIFILAGSRWSEAKVKMLGCSGRPLGGAGMQLRRFWDATAKVLGCSGEAG